MYQNERWNEILRILKQYGFVTVKYLVEALHYSNATINRDLNALEKQGVVKRSYGGVELTENATVGTPIPFRYYKMRSEKHEIANLAGSLVEDNDFIFIDGSTTTEGMVKYLLNKKDITVVTNNLAIVSVLSEAGISVICLGGVVVEPPCMLGGIEAIENASRYHYDKVFISTGHFTADGKIGSGVSYYLLQKTAIENASEVYYLADHTKTVIPKRTSWQYLCDFQRVTGVISNYDFPPSTLERFPKTKFYRIEK